MTTEPPTALDHPAPPAAGALRRAWHSIRGRMLAGLMLVLPIVITVWVIYWLYSTLEKCLIDPLARLVLWKVQGRRPDTELPFVAEYEPQVAQLRQRTEALKSKFHRWVTPATALISVACFWIALSQVSVLCHAWSWRSPSGSHNP